MSEYQTIAESSTFIVLNKYTPQWESANTYQTEDALERELIARNVSPGGAADLLAAALFLDRFETEDPIQQTEN